MSKQPSRIEKTPGRSRGKRAELSRWLEHWSEREAAARIGEAEFGELLQALAPISESYLRRLLRDSGAALAPMIEGVRQGTLDELETTLLALLEEYEKGDTMRRAAVRRVVVTAKDHARWASRRRPEKAEMILWMVTWLENPPVFREWVTLRRAQLAAG
jgi:hypothetical protein